MTNKTVEFGSVARDKMMVGVSTLASAVKVTLGPKGRNVILQKHDGMPVITKDGVSVAREIKLEDHIENMGVQLIMEASNRACGSAGDGTTTATVLAEAIALSGMKGVAAGMNPIDLKRGIDLGVSVVVSALQEMSRPCDSIDTIAEVATISANNDQQLGSLIADAMERVGQDGIITVEDGTTFQDELVVVEGMSFDRGYASPFLVNNEERGTVEFKDALVLCFNGKLHTVRDIKGLLEYGAKNDKAMVIICEDITSEALNALVMNKMRGNLDIALVKTPGIGNERKERLTDIAVMTSATVIDPTKGDKLTEAQEDVFGCAKSIVITVDETTIVTNGDTADAVEERCETLRSQMQSTQYAQDAERIAQRIAKLTGGIAIIKVGATTEVEMKEKKDRIDDALSATRAAVEEGIVIGGGTALLRAANIATEAKDSLAFANADIKHGYEILVLSIVEPFKQILENAGKQWAKIAVEVENNDSLTFGYNSNTDTYEDFFESGVIDPLKVTRGSLQFAASVGSMIITTECAVGFSEKQDEGSMGGFNLGQRY